MVIINDKFYNVKERLTIYHEEKEKRNARKKIDVYLPPNLTFTQHVHKRKASSNLIQLLIANYSSLCIR